MTLFSIDNLLLLLPLQAVQWKYYRVKKNLLIQELYSYTSVSAEIFEPHGFLIYFISQMPKSRNVVD